MNIDERENYRQDDAYFQDEETRYTDENKYDSIDIDAPPADHSISENAEPDYGNDFAENEINSQKLDSEEAEGGEFEDEDEDEFDDNELDEEDELDEEELDDEDGTNPNRNL
ncbi:hypothetical protein ASE21_11680 [Flavobacterium sp. Root901]|uniref:hypothetical protein n=1 Tax=Flavobacterium sp. Root901 TaxID=1736605 RepID=UPI000709C0F8|nr:hypothetical protein [Flavobacterium sp. Root901]KRD10363.1 hypothetical protein ASE21_11680 [Flavobacterium sp. Root901]